MSSQQILDVLEHVAGAQAPLGPLAQKQIAKAALDAKSHQGDRILVQLARRDDLDESTKTVIERCSRAAAKAAWLSRKDHPSGYVDAAIAKEKRITVLAAVAAHPDATGPLLEALAKNANPKVACAILGRSDSPQLATERAISSLLESHNLTYDQGAKLGAAIRENPDTWPSIGRNARSEKAVHTLLTMRDYVFPKSELPRAARVLLRGWEEKLPAQSKELWRTDRDRRNYQHGATGLLNSPEWDTTWPEDLELAKLCARLRTYSTVHHDGGVLDDCFIRNFGTPEEKEAAERKAAARIAELEDARTTSDDARIRAILRKGDTALTGELANNPNLTFEHIAGPDRPYFAVGTILTKLYERGEDPIKIVAGHIVFDNKTVDALPEELQKAVGSDYAALGREIVRLQRATLRIGGRLHGVLGAVRVAQMLRNEDILRGAVPEFTIDEIAEILRHDYVSDSLKEQASKQLGTLLSDGLPSSEAWETFLVLSSQSEGSLAEAIKVASVV